MAQQNTSYQSVGGFDEGFREWGAEDTELGYRLQPVDNQGSLYRLERF